MTLQPFIISISTTARNSASAGTIVNQSITIARGRPGHPIGADGVGSHWDKDNLFQNAKRNVETAGRIYGSFESDEEFAKSSVLTYRGWMGHPDDMYG